jgi:hypothetical protein
MKQTGGDMSRQSLPGAGTGGTPGAQRNAPKTVQRRARGSAAAAPVVPGRLAVPG